MGIPNSRGAVGRWASVVIIQRVLDPLDVCASVCAAPSGSPEGAKSRLARQPRGLTHGLMHQLCATRDVKILLVPALVMRCPAPPSALLARRAGSSIFVL